MEEINTTNKQRLDKLKKDHYDAVTQMTNEHHEKVERLQRDNRASESKVT